MDWIITVDHTDSNSVGVGSIDPNNYDKSFMKNKFKLFDDDDNLYFEGIYDENSISDFNPEEEFEPLDWAMNDSGCTYMKYYNVKTKSWNIL